MKNSQYYLPPFLLFVSSTWLDLFLRLAFTGIFLWILQIMLNRYAKKPFREFLGWLETFFTKKNKNDDGQSAPK